MAEDIKAIIRAETAEAQKNLKGLADSFKTLEQKSGEAGKGLGVASLALGAIGGIAGAASVQISNFAGQILGQLITLPITAANSLLKITNEVGTLGNELAKTSQRQGIAIETLGELKYAAELADVSFEGLTKGFKFLNVAIDDTIKGKTSEASETLKDLGINLKNVDGTTRDTSEVILDIADKFATMKDGAEKTALAVKLFGARSGPDMIPLLNEGREGIRAYAEEARSLGVVFDEDLGKAAEDFEDSQTRVQAAILGTKITIARDFLPEITNINEEIATWISSNKELIAQNVQSFVEGLQTAVENLKTAFFGLPDEVKDTKDEMSLMAEVMIFLNEGILTFIEAVNAFRKSSAVLTFTDPTGLSRAFRISPQDKKQLDDLLRTIEITDKRVAAIRKNIDAYRQSQENANKTNKEAGITTQELADFWKAEGYEVEIAGDKTGEAGNKIHGALVGAGQASKSAGDQIKSLNEGMENQILSIKQATTALDENKFAAIEQAKAAFLAKGGNEALADEFERVAKQQLNSEKLKEFDDEVINLKQSTEELGVEWQHSLGLIDDKTAAEALDRIKEKYIVVRLQAQGFGDDVINSRDDIVELNQATTETKFKEHLLEQFSGLDLADIQIQNLITHYKEMVEVIKQAAADPDIANKFGLTQESASQLIVDLTQKTQKQITDLENKAYIDRLKNSDSFWDQMKGGFLEFADTIENDTTAISQFFANILSTMSQNFSDLFYNVLTGKFDNLVDVAKAAFEAILRAFLEMVAAIATRQIVISIAGLLGVDTKGAKATDVLGLGKDALGLLGGGGGGAGAGAAAVGAGVALPGLDLAGGAGAAAFLPGLDLAGGASGAALAGGTGVFASIGAALPWIGAGIALLSFAIPLFSGLFKKTPRLDIDFDSVKTEVGRRAAFVSEITDDQFFEDVIAQISVKRGGVGLGAGGDDAIKKIIQDALEAQINQIQAIINKLPSDLAAQLNDELLNTQVDIDTEVAGERFLEFDAKGKKIKEKFEAFINGELQAKFLFAIGDFFEGALEDLGVLPGKAQEFMDKKFEEYKNAGSREARAKVGQELLEDFNAFVDAFNITEGNFNDSINISLNSLQNLSKELGFDTVPSIDELRDKLKEMLKNADIDPETLAKYTELRNTIIQLGVSLAETISGLVDFIDSLNEKIQALGGTAVDVSGALTESIDTIMGLLDQGGLSGEEREQLLREMGSLVDQWVADQENAQRAELEARKQAIDHQIALIDREREKAQQAAQERIDALNEELNIAKGLQDLADSIGKNIQSLLLGQGSIESPFQRLQRAQSELINLQTKFASSTGQERIDLGSQIQELFNTVIDIGGQAFDNTSPEFRDTFRQVINGLTALQAQVAPTKSIEEINQQIADITAQNQKTLEKLDARLESLQAQENSLSNQQIQLTGEAAEQARAYYEYIREQAVQLLNERLEQLKELGIDTSGALTAQEAISGEQLTVQRSMLDSLIEIADNTAKTKGISGTNVSDSDVIHAAKGFDGVVTGPQLFLAGEGGVSERVRITPLSVLHAIDTATHSQTDRDPYQIVNLQLSIDMRGSIFDSPERVRKTEQMLNQFSKKFKTEIKEEVFRDMRHNQKVKRYLGEK